MSLLTPFLTGVTDEQLKADVINNTIDLNKNYNKAELTYLSARLYKVRAHTEGTEFEAYPLNMKSDWALSTYQINALQTMKEIERNLDRNIRGGILAFNMGLGKTITSLTHSLICKHTGDVKIQVECDNEFHTEILSEENYINSPTLVVTKKIILSEWQTDLNNFFGDGVEYIILHSDFITKEELNSVTIEQLYQYEIVITTYDIISKLFSANKDYLLSRSCVCYDNGVLSHTKNVTKKELNINSKNRGCINLFDVAWKRIIFDESTKFVVDKTLVFKSVLALHGMYKWCLTGTPIKNGTKDIFNQFRVCNYTPVHKKCDVELRDQKTISIMTKHILSLDYSGAGVVLPSKNIIYMEFDMTQIQQECYDIIVKSSKKALSKYMNGSTELTTVFSYLCRMRQCCVAPILIAGKSFSAGVPMTTKPTFISSELDEFADWIVDFNNESGLKAPKIKGALNLIENIPKEDKILVFSSWSKCLKLLSSGLSTDDYCFIDGSTKGKDRNYLISLFKQTNKRILLLTLKLGSEGLNLTEANHIIIMEPWWTPAVVKQATSRAWRRGQKKEVHIYHLITKNSVEKRILEISEEKDCALDEFMKTKTDLKMVKKMLN
jgi:SNF2 family DNA or RNA helicase